METILEKLQFVEERMEALEEQLKNTKIEALEQRARAEVAETWLKIKNRKIVFMEEAEQDAPPPPPSKPTESWDTVSIPSPEQNQRFRTLPMVERRTSLPSPKTERRTSLPYEERRASLPAVERRTSFDETKRRSIPSPVESRASIQLPDTPSPKRMSLAKQCWPVVVEPSSIEVISVKVAVSQVVKAVQGYEDLILSRKETPLWNKELLREHAIHLGIEIFSKKKEQLLEDMRVSIENGAVVSNPIYILHLYEKRLAEVSLSDVNKETIEEHCKYYGIVTDGKRKNKLWDELRDVIRRGERPTRA